MPEHDYRPNSYQYQRRLAATQKKALKVKAPSGKSKVDYVERLEGYVDGVLSGEIMAGEKVRWACERHRRDIARQKTEGFPYIFSPDHVNRACRWIGNLVLSGGDLDGQQFTVYPWQCFVFGSAFGWLKYKKEQQRWSRTRRFKDVFISVARGNGKSPMAAAMALYVMLDDTPQERRREIYSIATKREQAEIVWNDAREFLYNTGRLRKLVEDSSIKMRAFDIISPIDGSRFMPLGGSSKSLDGLRPNVFIRDELHAWGLRGREMAAKLRTAMSKKSNAIMVTVTTAGNEESDLYLDETTYLTEVLDPDTEMADEQAFAYLAEIDDEDDPLDEETWPKANPMLGVSEGIIQVASLRKERDRAEAIPSVYDSFKRYHTNRLVRSTAKAIDPQLWSELGTGFDIERHQNVYLGFDWGTRDDLTALAACYPLSGVEIDGQWRTTFGLRAWVWIPSKSKARRLEETPWREWIDAGWVEVTEGTATNSQAIYDRVKEIDAEFQIKCIAADRHGATEFLVRCEDMIGCPIYPFNQTCMRYHEPLESFETAIVERRIRHEDNPVLNWCAQNMALKFDSSGHKMPCKERSVDKIDAIVAAIMAYERCAWDYATRVMERSAYDNPNVQHSF